MSDEDDSKFESGLRGFSLSSKRSESCSACVNLVNHENDELKCQIFTYRYEQLGVPRLDTISLNHAKYCEYFELKSERTSSSKNVPPSPDGKKESASAEVTYSTNICKRIEFSHGPNAHQTLLKTLFKYLGDDYFIDLVKLKKVANSTGKKKDSNEEKEVILTYSKNSSQKDSLSRHGLNPS